MKKIILAVALLLICVLPVFADQTYNTLNSELDMPKLIGLKQLSPDLYLGVSVEKPVASNLFHNNFAGIEDDKEYLLTAKVTYYGCWINCPNK